MPAPRLFIAYGRTAAESDGPAVRSRPRRLPPPTTTGRGLSARRIMLTAMFREPRIRAAAVIATGALVLTLLGFLAHVAWLARLGFTFLVVGAATTTAATVFVRGRQLSK